MIRNLPSPMAIEAANAFVKKAAVPKPPSGSATWLDWAVGTCISSDDLEAHARAELEALRKSLEDTRDALARQFDNVLEVLRQRDALQAKVEELRADLAAEKAKGGT